MRDEDLTPDMSDADWTAYELKAEKGGISGRIQRGDDGRVYYYIGE